MTEAMPFLQKTILLSYDPRPFTAGLFSSLFYRFSSVSLRRLPALPAKSSARRMRRNDAP